MIAEYDSLSRNIQRIDPDQDCDALHIAWIELNHNSFKISPSSLFQRARFRVIDEQRAKKKRSADALLRYVQVPERVSLVDEVINRERNHCLRDAVDKLPEPYREAVTLRYFEQKSVKQIAHTVGKPVQTIHTRLRRAIDQLRNDPNVQSLEV